AREGRRPGREGDGRRDERGPRPERGARVARARGEGDRRRPDGEVVQPQLRADLRRDRRATGASEQHLLRRRGGAPGRRAADPRRGLRPGGSRRPRARARDGGGARAPVRGEPGRPRPVLLPLRQAGRAVGLAQPPTRTASASTVSSSWPRTSTTAASTPAAAIAAITQNASPKPLVCALSGSCPLWSSVFVCVKAMVAATA